MAAATGARTAGTGAAPSANAVRPPSTTTLPPGSAAPRRSSLQQVGLAPDDHLVERLEVEPPDRVAADLAGGDGGVVLADGDRRARRLRQQLRLAGPSPGAEPTPPPVHRGRPR